MNKMNVVLRLLSLTLLFTFTVSASAQELSCDDLIELSDTSAFVQEALAEVGTISEGDEVDSALGELIDGLEAVAEIEGNYALEDQIAMMAEGWNDFDGDTLMSGLNGAIASMDSLISNDCD